MLAVFTITHVSLHTDSPGADGAMGEIDAERGVVAFGAPEDGRISLTADVTILVGEPVTISHVGYWNETVFVLSQAITPQTITEPSNFILQANTTYIEI
ncbi:hypothetical protein GCM10007984_24020 [Shewanella putrefaciens]|nr:hypothetical protein SPWS13_0089 [Shewanella putrefaciens]GGN23347.1 hypothetical protein GCM10007984_24020 [Shewanella putrefaciens]